MEDHGVRVPKRKAKPCSHHLIASPDYTMPEVLGMVQDGIIFTICPDCLWVVKN